MDMDRIWQMLTANFLLLVGIACLVLAYVVFQGSALAAVCVYSAFILIGLGIARGLFAIIDHNRAEKETE